MYLKWLTNSYHTDLDKWWFGCVYPSAPSTNILIQAVHNGFHLMMVSAICNCHLDLASHLCCIFIAYLKSIILNRKIVWWASYQTQTVGHTGEFVLFKQFGIMIKEFNNNKLLFCLPTESMEWGLHFGILKDYKNYNFFNCRFLCNKNRQKTRISSRHKQPHQLL